MNRIIIIGNGFDKAHKLKTGYRDFIDTYWSNVSDHILDKSKHYYRKHFNIIHPPTPYEDKFVSFKVFYSYQNKEIKPSYPESCSSPYDKLQRLIAMFNDPKGPYEGSVCFTFKNKFFEHISSRCSLTNWVDIENEYYEKLKELLTEKNTDERNKKVRELNQDFDAVKKLLEDYLTKEIERVGIKTFPSIQEAFNSVIEPNEVAHAKQREVFAMIINNPAISDSDLKERWRDFCSHNKIEGKCLLQSLLEDYGRARTDLSPKKTLILNFNYTSTAEKHYKGRGYEVINIHGQLNDENNPIIFGYGDELDDDYRQIEKLQDNDFLENMKSIRYHETSNYRKLLGFIEADLYQVVIMGHSCGNSDRTLLNTLFEHSNCISVKVYYHQKKEGDNYSELVRNLSRNFNDKSGMRDKVVNKEYCKPLVPYSEP